MKNTSPPRRTFLKSTGAATVAGLAGCLDNGGGDTTTESGSGDGTTTSTASGESTTTNTMRYVAHRGCMAQYPENTLTAIRQSAPAVDMIETDVRRCGSGELVVFHDETLDRVTDTTGPVAEASFERLRNVDVLQSGEGVPLLSEVFETTPDDVALNLELKGEGVAADVVSMADEYDHDVVLSSFDVDKLSAARDADCESLAFLFVDDFEEGLDIATELGCRYVHPHYRLCVETRLVGAAHDQDFEVNAWTVKSNDTLAVLEAAGVDGVIVDDCELTSSKG